MHVSYSQLNTWRRCRRRWYFSYVEQLHSPGFSPSLWLGSGVHEALANYYMSVTREPEILLSSFAMWAAEERERIQEEIATSILLPQVLFDLDKSFNLGMGMLDYYGQHAPDLDKDFYVLQTEQEFNLPIGITHFVEQEDGDIIEEEITYKGRIDGVIKMKDTGKLYLLEHKTAKDFNEKKLILDQQATSYMWAAEQLTGLEISGVYYNILRKQLNSSRVKKPLIYRLAVDRSRAAIDGFQEHVKMIVKDMQYAAQEDLYYHTPSEDCTFCSYFTPCSMIQDAADPTEYIREFYKTGTIT